MPSVQCVLLRAVGVSTWGSIDFETAKAGVMIEDRPGEGTISVAGIRLLPSLPFCSERQIMSRQRQETRFLLAVFSKDCQIDLERGVIEDGGGLEIRRHRDLVKQTCSNRERWSDL